MRLKSLTASALLALMSITPAMAADIRIAIQDDPDTLDPAQSRAFTGRYVFTALCDKLVDLSPEATFIPMLATDWAYSDDGLQLIMNLRDDVVFHDGEKFNAEAVVYNLERMATLPESRRKSEVASIASTEATGEYQVTINLKHADASLIGQFSDRAGMMISPKAGEALGADFASAPVCSGPFKFVERVAQAHIKLEKFADYYNAENVFLDTVTYIPIQDTTVRLANLRSGDVDFVDRIAATDAEAVKNDPNLTYFEVVGLGNMGMYVNVGNGDAAKNPMGESAVLRQAFSIAIDREAINQVVFAGGAMAGNQSWPPTSPWYNTDFPVPARDIEKAKALIAEAGFDRVPVEIIHGNNPITTQAMQMIQAMVSEAGFDVTLRSTEFATLLDLQTAGSYQVSRSDWSGRADPDGNIHQFMTCAGGLNDPKYCNPEVDRLLDAARSTYDPAERKALYDQTTQYLNADLPIIYIGHQKYQFGMAKSVTGFNTAPDAMIRLVGVKNEK